MSRRLRLGAARAAPTAPHALPADSSLGQQARTGPERFWDRRRTRIALIASACASILVHYALNPISLRSRVHFEVRDVDGALTIPIDILEEKDEAPAAPAPAPRATEPPANERTSPEGESEIAHGAAHRHARGVDAGAPDASTHAPTDAGVAEEAHDANPRDPSSMIGVAGEVQAGPPLVVLLVNFAAIRAHPVGARLGPLVFAIPQWAQILNGVHVDPLRDADWVLITGPSLLHTERDAVILHYNAPDAVADRAMDLLRRRSPNGAPLKLGAGVKGVLAFADRAPRAVIRPQSHVLAVVPPDYAPTAARILSHAKVGARVRPHEAMRLVLQNPNHPFPLVPPAIREARVWVVLRDDGGADVFAEGPTSTAQEAADAVRALTSFHRQYTQSFEGFGVNIATRGLLHNLTFRADGPLVRVHLTASREQLEAIAEFAAAQLDVTLPPTADAP